MKALFCLLLLSLPALGQDWQTFSFARDNFQISAPGAFEVEEEKDGAGWRHFYTRSRSANSGVMVVVSSRTDADLVAPDQALEHACSAGAEGIGAEILSQQALELNGTPGRACSMTTDVFNISVHIYATEDRLYQLISTSSKSEPPWPEEQRFFDSFKFTGD